MKKKLLSMLMLVSLLVTAMPTAFTAAEGDVTKTFTTIFHSAMDEEKNALEGVESRIELTDGIRAGLNLTEYNAEGISTCEITYNGDMFIYEYEKLEEGKEQPTHYRYQYPYIRVVVNGVPNGYDESAGYATYVYSVDEFLEMVGEGDGATVYYPIDTFEEELVGYGEDQNTWYEIYREYYSEKYGNTSVYFECSEKLDSAKLVEALNCLDKAKDTCLNVYVTAYEYGEGFPTISAEAMAILNEYDAFVRIVKDSTYEEVYWWPTSSDNAFELTVAENASVTEGLDAAKIPYVLFSAKGMEGSEELVFYYGIEGGILADGTYREDDGSYEDIKCLYYYDTTNKIFKLCDEEVGYYCAKDMETEEYYHSQIIYEGELPISGYYVIVDQLLPDSLTTVPTEPETPTGPENPTEPEVPKTTDEVKEAFDAALENTEEPETAVNVLADVSNDTLVEMIQKDPEFSVKVEKLDETIAENMGDNYKGATSKTNAVDASKVQVVGLAINAVNASAETVELSFAKPEKEATVAEGYKNSIQLDIRLLVDGTSLENLAVPVTITMPIPTGVDTKDLVILHYHGDAKEPVVIVPTVNTDGTMTFIVDGFSTFVIANQITEATVPKTGDSSTTVIICSLLLLAAGVVLMKRNAFAK